MFEFELKDTTIILLKTIIVSSDHDLNSLYGYYYNYIVPEYNENGLLIGTKL